MDPVVPFPWWGDFDSLMVVIGLAVFCVCALAVLFIAVIAPRDEFSSFSRKDTRRCYYASGILAVLAVLAWVLGPWLIIPVLAIGAGAILWFAGKAIYKSVNYGFRDGDKPGPDAMSIK